MSTQKKGMFVTADGRNVVFTFVLVSSLFLLWGFCNGMIDVMDKHFQDELGLTMAQSAWVQFAHYLGYFLMSLPAGWLATKLGYKGGIIAGLLMVAVGGFWFIPATRIASFWAFLLGVCVIAAGLTFLETIANPYTTVLGDPRYAATRINLAQSCNGIGWIFGPIVGQHVLLRQGRSGREHRQRRRSTFRTPASPSWSSILRRRLLLRRRPRHQDGGRLPPRRRDARASRTPSGRIRTSVMAVARPVPLRGGAGRHLQLLHQLHDLADAAPARVLDERASSQQLDRRRHGGAALKLSDKGAANLASLGFVCFLVGRFSGAAILRKYSAHKVLGLYGVVNVADVPARLPEARAGSRWPVSS